MSSNLSTTQIFLMTANQKKHLEKMNQIFDAKMKKTSDFLRQTMTLSKLKQSRAKTIENVRVRNQEIIDQENSKKVQKLNSIIKNPNNTVFPKEKFNVEAYQTQQSKMIEYFRQQERQKILDENLKIITHLSQVKSPLKNLELKKHQEQFERDRKVFQLKNIVKKPVLDTPPIRPVNLSLSLPKQVIQKIKDEVFSPPKKKFNHTQRLYQSAQVSRLRTQSEEVSSPNKIQDNFQSQQITIIDEFMHDPNSNTKNQLNIEETARFKEQQIIDKFNQIKQKKLVNEIEDDKNAQRDQEKQNQILEQLMEKI